MSIESKLRNCSTENKLYARTKSYEDLDDSTDTSSFNMKSSWQGSPVLTALDESNEVESDKATKTENHNKSKGKTAKCKHSEYFCKASYKFGPMVNEMPIVDF